MPAHMLLSPPKYLHATEADAIAALRDLRDAGAIAAHSQRWYLRNRIIRKDAKR